MPLGASAAVVNQSAGEAHITSRRYNMQWRLSFSKINCYLFTSRISHDISRREPEKYRVNSASTSTKSDRLLDRAVRRQMSETRVDCQVVLEFHDLPPESSDNQPKGEAKRRGPISL